MKRILLISILFSTLGYGKGIQVDTFLVKKEAEINEILTALRNVKTENEQLMFNEELKQELKELLVYPGVMDYPFESWTTMSTIKSPDGEFRIFNWNIEDQNLIHSHFCYVVRPRGGDRPNIVYELKEDKITLGPNPDDNMLTTDHWYGALYYKIIPIEKGRKKYYTIIGFSGKDRSTNMKLIDVFYFKGKSMRMGYPIFQEEKGSTVLKHRVFFKYSEKASVSVNMNEKLGAIVFDHLVPELPSLEGMYDFYIPDMTYDGYKWDGEKWAYEEDLIAYNDPNKNIKLYGPDDNGGGNEFVSIKDQWIDPVDGGNPMNGNDAIAPIEDVRDDKKNKDEYSTRRGNGKKRRFNLFKRKVKPISAIGDDGSITKTRKAKREEKKKKKKHS